MDESSITVANKTLRGRLVYSSDFRSLEDFWWEGTPDVSARDGSLFVRTVLQRVDSRHFVSTVFCRRPLKGNVLVEFDARSIHPEGSHNFNFFLHTTMPDGRDLFATRGERTGDYPEYHAMNNYLFTFLPAGGELVQAEKVQDWARWRFRRNPGFRLMKEVNAPAVVNDRWYHFQYLVHEGLIAASVDRDPLETYAWRDDAPLTGGHMGFRTYCSHIEYRDLKVWQIAH
jgi:hypothetical protein